MTDSSGLVDKSIAVMFPGQGSQFPGMAGDLLVHSQLARDMIEQANSILGFSLDKIMAGDMGDDLNRTIYTQPAIFVHSMMLWHILVEKTGIRPKVAAGHSLGEYSALCAAGALTFEQALRCINLRAREMDGAQPPGACGMAAVVGLSKDRVCEILDSMSCRELISVANINSGDQTVISGNLAALVKAVDAFSQEKRVRCVMLPVSSAFHTEFMASARDKLREFLMDLEIKPTRFNVIANTSARSFPTDTIEMKNLLSQQVTNPVLWHDSVLEMLSEKPDFFIEVGPGKVLSGLLKRIDRNIMCYNVSSISDIDTFLDTNK